MTRCLILKAAFGFATKRHKTLKIRIGANEGMRLWAFTKRDLLSGKGGPPPPFPSPAGERPELLSRLAPSNLVGTARCAVRAAFNGATAPPAASRAGTSQRDVPTEVRFIGRGNGRRQVRLFGKFVGQTPVPDTRQSQRLLKQFKRVDFRDLARPEHCKELCCPHMRVRYGCPSTHLRFCRVMFQNVSPKNSPA